MVTIGSTSIGRTIFQPGWKWSNDVKPIAGTEQCMILHKGYCSSPGEFVSAPADGTEAHITAGDGYVVEPGHDGWVAGDGALRRGGLRRRDGGVREAQVSGIAETRGIVLAFHLGRGTQDFMTVQRCQSAGP